MLPKKQRLGTRDINRIRAVGKTLSTGGYVFWWMPSETAGFRCAVTATGAAGRNAVVRNKTRRSVFEAIEKEKTLLREAKLDILIVCRKEPQEGNEREETKKAVRQAVEIMKQEKKHDTKRN